MVNPDGDTHLARMNSALLSIIPDEKVEPLLKKIKILDEINTEVGVRAFVWNIEQTY